MNTPRATTVANSDAANPQHITPTHSVTAPGAEPTHFRKDLTSRQAQTAVDVVEQISKAICWYCKDGKHTSNGYFYRGSFYCDKCIWLLAEAGEFYCG